MSLNGFSHPLLAIALTSSLGLVTLQSSAAGQCKGLEASVCQERADCTWVSSYTTRNGNSVPAYCRAASGKAKQGADSQQESNQKPTAKAEDNKEEKRG